MKIRKKWGHPVTHVKGKYHRHFNLRPTSSVYKLGTVGRNDYYFGFKVVDGENQHPIISIVQLLDIKIYDKVSLGE